jgi:ATP-dependent protease ClpP protease subunit
MVYQYARPKRDASEEEEHDEFKFPFLDTEKKPYKQYDQTFSAQHVHFYLSKEIGPAEGYTDMVHRIASASPTDVIFIHLNTPGGHMDTGVQIINAMRNSQAKVVTILESTAYSLGTLIFLAGDEMVVNEHCMMMFHNFNGGLIGKGNELVSELEATVKWFASLARNIYVPFLTDEEVDRISRGEDMWMQTPEIKLRLENMVKVLVEREAKERAEAKAARAANTDKPTPKKRVPKEKKAD